MLHYLKQDNEAEKAKKDFLNTLAQYAKNRLTLHQQNTLEKLAEEWASCEYESGYANAEFDYGEQDD